jgi:hypothetical protein
MILFVFLLGFIAIFQIFNPSTLLSPPIIISHSQCKLCLSLLVLSSANQPIVLSLHSLFFHIRRASNTLNEFPRFEDIHYGGRTDEKGNSDDPKYRFMGIRRIMKELSSMLPKLKEKYTKEYIGPHWFFSASPFGTIQVFFFFFVCLFFLFLCFLSGCRIRFVAKREREEHHGAPARTLGERKHESLRFQ